MIEVYVGFSAVCWCYISCEMTDDTSLQENVCWDKLTYQLLLNFALAVWVDAQPALQVWRLQGFSPGNCPPYIWFIVQSNHNLSACQCRELWVSCTYANTLYLLALEQGHPKHTVLCFAGNKSGKCCQLTTNRNRLAFKVYKHHSRDGWWGCKDNGVTFL